MAEAARPARGARGERPRRRVRGWVAAVGAATALAPAAGLAVPAPAAAHPFGPPLTLDVTVEGRQVEATWRAADDDWVILGDHLEVFTSGTRTGAEQLADAPAVRTYLLERIEIRDAEVDRSCDGEVAHLDAADLDTAGARLRFTCDRAPEQLAIRVETLMDVHPAYRVAVRADGLVATDASMLTAVAPLGRFTLGSGGDPLAGSAALLAGALFAAASATAVVVRRRRRETTP
ncbi:hypothetical protein FTX61_12895 [Nitriliruptoraceae bacterium ZYF776]|nr:hypothetical protein [Profundirhabdus halotolerans]